MTNFVNYKQILIDFQALIEGAGIFKKVTKNANDTDFVYPNMPMCDVRFKQVTPLNLSGNQYYADILIEAEIACFDMTSRDKCATMRDDLTSQLQWLVQANSRFSAYVDATQVGPVQFETGESKAQGEFIAAAVLEFHAKLYSGAP